MLHTALFSDLGALVVLQFILESRALQLSIHSIFLSSNIFVHYFELVY